MTAYVFDPAWTMEHDRLLAIESLYDEDSMRHLVRLGVGPGWHCLEVGCGAGGIARRLARLVDGGGRVVAIDLDTRFIDGHDLKNLQVRRQDLMVDALEPGVFDLVHARAVIMHVPDHQRALRRVAAAVRPGGWVVIEDVDFGGPMSGGLARYVHPTEHADLAERVYRAIEAVLGAAGADASFGSRLAGGLKAAGLEAVGGALHAPLVAGGTEMFGRGTVAFLRPHLVRTGLVSVEEVECFLALLGDGTTTYAPPVMATVWGRRPAA